MINTLTSLRFVFALVVFLSHIHLFGRNRLYLENLNLNYLNEGHLGVSFFFILSGFILAYNYQESFLNKTISKKHFWVNRIARIYPLHLITLLLSILVSLNGFRRETLNWIIKFFQNGFLIQSWFPNEKIYWSFNAPSWSISNELFFYVVFPFLIYYFSKNRKLIYFYLVIILIIISVLPNHLSKEYCEAFFNIFPLFRLSDFMLGIIIFQLYLILKKSEINLNYFLGTILEIAIISLLFIFYFYRNNFSISIRYSCYYWIPMSLTILVFSLQTGLVSSILQQKLFIILGEISFSFYLIHMIVARYFNLFIDKIELFQNDWILVLTIFSFSILLSFISHYYLENRISNKIKMKFNK